MFGGIRKLLGIISVTEKNDIVTISGFATKLVTRDIKTVFETSRVANNMFINVTPSSITFHSFFALEVKYILETLLESSSLRVSRRSIAAIIQGLKTNTWLKDTEVNYDNIINLNKTKPIKFKLFEEQLGFINYYNHVKPRFRLMGALYAGEAGSGKTIGSIATQLAREKDFVIVICPRKVAIDVWKKTLTQSIEPAEDVWVVQEGLPLNKPHKWMVFHYEELGTALKIVNKYNLNRNVGILLDEGHNMNTSTSIRTNLFVDLCKATKSDDIIWCSGTPFKAIGSEAIPFFRTIIPNFNDDVEKAMRKIFTKQPGKANEILRHRLGIVSYTVPRERFMKDKPIEAAVRVKIPNGDKYTLNSIRDVMSKFIIERFNFYKENKPKYQKIYDDALSIFKATLRTPKEKNDFEIYRKYVSIFIKQGYDNATMGDMSKYCNDYELKTIIPTLPQALRNPFKDARSVIKYVDLKIKGECLGRILGRERINCHIDMIKNIDFGDYIENSLKKVLVFTDFIEVLKATQSEISDAGYKSIVIYGDNTKELDVLINKFRDDPELVAAIATYKSLSEGVPVTVANTGLFINQPFRWHQKTQAVARMHRVGQDELVYIFNFTLDTGNIPNISTRSEDIMAWSKTQVDEMMGIGRYGSDINIDDIELGEGTESFDKFDGFINDGLEAYYEDIKTLGLFVTEPPMSVCDSLSLRNTALAW